jgi:hypothetical protein
MRRHDEVVRTHMSAQNCGEYCSHMQSDAGVLPGDSNPIRGADIASEILFSKGEQFLVKFQTKQSAILCVLV